MKSVYALLVSGVPPFIIVIFRAIKSRTLDLLGFLVVLAFVISAIIAVVTRNSTTLLLEKSLATCTVAVIFAITLIPFRCCKHRCHWRPFAYYFYQDLIPTKRADVGLPDNIFDNKHKQTNEYHEDEVSISKKLSKKEKKKEISLVYDWIYVHCRSFRIACYLITSVWSVGFISEFGARLTLIFLKVSVTKIVIYGNVILSTITAVCIILTVICVIKERKHTLVLIKKWKEEHLNMQQQLQVRRSTDVHVWIVTEDFNANYRV
jgi:hypothetical protein